MMDEAAERGIPRETAAFDLSDLDLRTGLPRGEDPEGHSAGTAPGPPGTCSQVDGGSL